MVVGGSTVNPSKLHFSVSLPIHCKQYIAGEGLMHIADVFCLLNQYLSLQEKQEAGSRAFVGLLIHSLADGELNQLLQLAWTVCWNPCNC